MGLHEPSRRRPSWPVGTSLPERFWDKVTPEPTSGCWLWTSALNKGYGAYQISGKVRYAHRMAYEDLVGKIPDGLVLDHKCRNPQCCNPDHLRAVSQAQNIFFGEWAPAKNRVKTHCQLGHEYSKENTGFSFSKVREKVYKHRYCKTCNNARLAVFNAAKKAKRMSK